MKRGLWLVEGTFVIAALVLLLILAWSAAIATGSNAAPERGHGDIGTAASATRTP